jgi:hypothetical protein
MASLEEQLLLNSQPLVKRVQVYSPPVEEETVIQEEDTDLTPE